MKKKDRQTNKERDRQLSRFTAKNRDGLKPAGRHNRLRKKAKDRIAKLRESED